jgi:hypothetical protein
MQSSSGSQRQWSHNAHGKCNVHVCHCRSVSVRSGASGCVGVGMNVLRTLTDTWVVPRLKNITRTSCLIPRTRISKMGPAKT